MGYYVSSANSKFTNAICSNVTSSKIMFSKFILFECKNFRNVTKLQSYFSEFVNFECILFSNVKIMIICMFEAS
jgi:hypothetical protein